MTTMKDGVYSLPEVMSIELMEDDDFDLSSTENTRLYRSFLRFELYCRAFQDSYRFQRANGFSPGDQFDMFIRRMAPWEVEEITCVQHYLTSFVSNALDGLETEFEAALMKVAVAEAALEQRDRDSTNATQHLDLIDLSDPDMGNLDMFSDDFAYNRILLLGTMVSPGLNYLFELATTPDKDRRFLMVRQNYAILGKSLPAALELSPVEDAGYEQPENVPVNDPAHANLGYHLHRARTSKKYLPIRRRVNVYPIRVLGYVFWDSDRIRSANMSRALCIGTHLSDETLRVRYSRSSDTGLQTRLQHIKLHEKDLLRLEEEYGFIESEY